MTLIKEDVEELIEKLNKLAGESLHYKGEITTNAKGEASFKVRVYSDNVNEIQTSSAKILDGLKQVCKEKDIKIAGS